MTCCESHDNHRFHEHWPLVDRRSGGGHLKGKEAVIFALLELAKRLAEQQPTGAGSISPSTPSGMIPPYQKPPAKGRHKRPGREVGHPGTRPARFPRGSTSTSRIAWNIVPSARDH